MEVIQNLQELIFGIEATTGQKPELVNITYQEFYDLCWYSESLLTGYILTDEQCRKRLREGKAYFYGVELNVID